MTSEKTSTVPVSPLLLLPSSSVPPSPQARVVSPAAQAELQSNVLLLVYRSQRELYNVWFSSFSLAPSQGEPLISAMLGCQEFLKLLVNKPSQSLPLGAVEKARYCFHPSPLRRGGQSAVWLGHDTVLPAQGLPSAARQVAAPGTPLPDILPVSPSVEGLQDILMESDSSLEVGVAYSTAVVCIAHHPPHTHSLEPFLAGCWMQPSLVLVCVSSLSICLTTSTHNDFQYLTLQAMWGCSSPPECRGSCAMDSPKGTDCHPPSCVRWPTTIPPPPSPSPPPAL